MKTKIQITKSEFSKVEHPRFYHYATKNLGAPISVAYGDDGNPIIETGKGVFELYLSPFKNLSHNGEFLDYEIRHRKIK